MGINIVKVDLSYVQTSNECVLASYGLVSNYLTDGNVSVVDVLKNFGIYLDLDSVQKSAIEENLAELSYRFHVFCRLNKDLRGYEFIQKFNLENDNFEILFFRAYYGIQISEDELNYALNLLKEKDCIGMFLKLNDDKKVYHSVVVGFDTERNTFFIRDPQSPKIIYDPDFRALIITEFIVFKK